MKKGVKSLVHLFKDFVAYRHSTGNPIQDWLALTQEEYDEFRINTPYSDLSSSTPSKHLSPSSKTRSPPAQSTSICPASLLLTAHPLPEVFLLQSTSLAHFHQGAKHDPSLFPVLKDDKHNDSWHRAFCSQARAQDVSEVYGCHLQSFHSR